MRLDALEEAVGAHILDDRELLFLFRHLFLTDTAAGKPLREFLQALLEFFLRHRPPEDVVADVVAEVGDLARRAGRSPSQRQIEAERVLGIEVGVPNLEREIARVRAEVEELLERRVARGARDADGNRHARRWPPPDARAGRPSRTRS